MDLLLSMQLAKLKSEYPMIFKWLDLRYVSLKSSIPCRYCMTHFVAFQWIILGLLKYLSSIPIMYAISRHVTNLSIHETSYYWCIRDVLHLFLINFVLWVLKQIEFINLSNGGISLCTILHAKFTKHFINICLLW